MRFNGINTVSDNLDGYHKKTVNRMEQNMDMIMGQAENHSKQTAPWTDRTANARNSIYGMAVRTADVIKGYHGIRMFYGVYLELKDQGKYRVIGPTMDWLNTKVLKWLAS